MWQLLLIGLLALGLPWWALLRGRYGKYFALLLLAAGVGGIAAIVATERYLAEHALNPGNIRKALELHLLTCAGFGVVLLYKWLRSLESNRADIPPWSTGEFYLRNLPTLATDLLGGFVITFFFAVTGTEVFTQFDDPNLPAIAGTFAVSFGAFLLAGGIARANRGVLPIADRIRRAKSPPARTPTVPSLAAKTRPPRDDLAGIFSRRHPDLAAITHSSLPQRTP